MSRQSQSRRAEFSNNLKEKQNERHVQPKSQKMVSQLHRKALSEIFDVLLITAQMQRDQARMPGVRGLGPGPRQIQGLVAVGGRG